MQICIVLYLILSCFTNLHNAPDMEEKQTTFCYLHPSTFYLRTFCTPPQCLLIGMIDGFIGSNVTTDKRHRRYWYANDHARFTNDYPGYTNDHARYTNDYPWYTDDLKLAKFLQYTNDNDKTRKRMHMQN